MPMNCGSRCGINTIAFSCGTVLAHRRAGSAPSDVDGMADRVGRRSALAQNVGARDIVAAARRLGDHATPFTRARPGSTPRC
jgi:hypothetical protein